MQNTLKQTESERRKHHLGAGNKYNQPGTSKIWVAKEIKGGLGASEELGVHSVVPAAAPRGSRIT